jgi:uncharacterized protein YhaN
VHVSEMAERLILIEAAETKQWRARIVVDAVGEDAEAIDALLLQFPDDDTLAGRRSEITAEIDRLEAERVQLIVDARDLELRCQELTDSEVLSALLEEQETLAEETDEVERSKKVLEHSVAILSEVIDRFEVENQVPAVKRARGMLQRVVPSWGDLILEHDADGKVRIERRSGSDRVAESKLSDGARSLLYLALRLAFATDDAERRGVALPILCDDPLVHLDDSRRTGAIALLADAARTHQVVLFTCDTSTSELAQRSGAHVITI